MLKNYITVLPVILISFVFLFAGCGKSGPVRHDVSGEITFDGKPLPIGKLIFMPDGSAGNDGPQGFMAVRDGQFSTASAAEGKGVGSGAYTVEIRGFDGVPYQGPEGEVADGQMLFMPFREKITLPEGDSTITITVVKSAAGPQATVEVEPQ